MKLALPFEPPWRVDEARDHRRVAIGAELVVAYGPIEIASDAAWWNVELPDGVRVQLARPTEHATRDGWPFLVAGAELVGATGLVEVRLYARYSFLAHAALAVVRAASVASIEARRAELLGIFERGRPDWRDLPICLADAWDLEPRPGRAISG